MSTTTGHEVIYSPLGNDPVLGDIVRLYVDEMPQRIAALAAAHQTGDRQRLMTLAHQIKGSAGSHGFYSVTRLAGQLENLVRDDAPDAIAQAVADLIDACGRARCQ
jgi:HPt (histidine-containing phosphotransfer) domain-containing protein